MHGRSRMTMAGLLLWSRVFVLVECWWWVVLVLVLGLVLRGCGVTRSRCRRRCGWCWCCGVMCWRCGVAVRRAAVLLLFWVLYCFGVGLFLLFIDDMWPSLFAVR